MTRGLSLRITWLHEAVSASTANDAVQQVFKSLPCHTHRKWASQGLQFFGLHLLKVNLPEPEVPAQNEPFCHTPAQAEDLSPLTRRIRTVQRRSTGPSSQLGKQHRAARMHLCEEAVNLIIFGDLVDFLKHVMEASPDIVDSAIDHCLTYFTHLSDKVA